MVERFLQNQSTGKALLGSPGIGPGRREDIPGELGPWGQSGFSGPITKVKLLEERRLKRMENSAASNVATNEKGKGRPSNPSCTSS